MLSRHAAVLLAVCVGLSIRFTAAIFRCHNHCSGHGYCNAENVCVCEKGLYRGVDCSECKSWLLHIWMYVDHGVID